MQHSNLKASYRTLHNELYQRFGKTTAFTASDVQQIAHELTGKSLAEWWQQQVEQRLQLDSAALLAAAGLTRKFGKKQRAFSGISSSYAQGVDVISKVEKDSPAWQAGFTAGDELVAVEQLKLKSSLAERLKDFKPGQRINLSFFRAGRLLQKQLTLTGLAEGPSKIVPLAKPNRAQRQFHQAWLGVDLVAK